MKVSFKITSFLTGLLFLTMAVLLSVNETLAYNKTGIFSQLGSRIWVFWTLFYAVTSIVVILHRILVDLRMRQFLGLQRFL